MAPKSLKYQLKVKGVKMNKRIRKLAEQAGFSSGAMINIGTGEAEELWIRYNESDDREEFPTSKMMEKFAELIVKECAQFVEDKFDFIGEEIVVKEKMLEYFGVES
jgi:hypothetical protein